ncbi:MAG: hypothetical protein JSR93_10250 [Verrucomicrobia bacterium]|nr:hypothetical protein [Verrucomicrobiota bacterium]
METANVLPAQHSSTLVQNPDQCAAPLSSGSYTANTLSSLAETDDFCGSFCENFTGFFHSASDRFLQKISRIPGFGSLYHREAAEPTTHAGRLELLYTTFRTAIRSPSPPTPTHEQLHRLIEHFRQLSDPIEQVEAFSHIQRSANTSDAIVRSFFDTLPDPAQEGIKNKIVHNYVRSRNEQRLTLDRSADEVVEHTLNHQIRTIYMNAAIVNYLNALRRTAY